MSDQLDMFAALNEPDRVEPKFKPRDELSWETLELPDTPEGRLFVDELRKKWGQL